MSGHYVTEDLADIARQIQLERLKQQQMLTHKTREEIEKARLFEESKCYQILSGEFRCCLSPVSFNKISFGLQITIIALYYAVRFVRVLF